NHGAGFTITAGVVPAVGGGELALRTIPASRSAMRYAREYSRKSSLAQFRKVSGDGPKTVIVAKQNLGITSTLQRVLQWR
ncbi:MAG: hypothetical protein ABEH64_07905, partial [Salinirussus sp.]